MSGFFAFSTTQAIADTVYLKNGNRVEGVVENENADQVEFNLGFGTTVFKKSEIARVERSDSDQTQQLWDRWAQAKKDQERRGPEEEKKRRESREAAERLKLEYEKKKQALEQAGGKEIRVKAESGQILLNVLLNDEVPATLLLDSGASVTVLSQRLASKLGVEVDRLKKIQVSVADGRMVEAAFTTIKRLKVRDSGVVDPAAAGPAVDLEDVEVCFLTQEAVNTVEEGGGQKVRVPQDGLLGMSFLKYFQFNADYENGRIIFERLKKGDVQG